MSDKIAKKVSATSVFGILIFGLSFIIFNGMIPRLIYILIATVIMAVYIFLISKRD